MKKISILVFVLTLFSVTVYAGKSVDKVTGEFTHNDAIHRLVSAHESVGKHPQKGYVLSWRDNGRWYEIDFNDMENSCINVFANGHARIGGLVSAGNGPQVGRYFGLFIVDGGEPGTMADHGYTYRVSTDYWSEEARLAILDWCETGVQAGLTNETIWPSVVTDGNLQVHNSPYDID